jgi:Tol biopolymer transport system component
MEEIIRKALEKDRDLRCQTAAELGADLKRVKRDTESGRRAGETPTGWARLLVPRRWPLAMAGILALIAASGFLWFATHRTPPPRLEPKPRRLTANPPGDPATYACISPDGKYLAYGDHAGIHLEVIDTGQMRTIPQPQGVAQEVTGWSPVGWFPDGTKLLGQVTSLDAAHSSLWVISVLGGAPHEIHKGGFAWSVSPDGSLIAFTSTPSDSDIWLMGTNGEEPRKIVTADEGESLNSVIWSPDSRRIVYERFRLGPKLLCNIESRDLKGGQPSVVLSDPKLETGYGGGFWWLADGRLIYALSEAASAWVQADENLWEIKVDTGSGKPAGQPRQITNFTDFGFGAPNATADGKRLVFSRVSTQADVYIGDLESGGKRLKFPPRRLTLDERMDQPTAWTPDSTAVLFQSDRNGNWDIYKQALDQESAEPFVATPQVELEPRLSADGAWFVYASLAKVEDLNELAPPAELRRVPVSGGPSELVLASPRLDDYRCARAPATLCLVSEPTGDRKQLVFTTFDPVKGRGHEVIRVATEARAFDHWDLSPDGSQIALLWRRENRVRLLPLAGGKPRDLVVSGWLGLNSLDWSPDGKGLYVSSRSPRGATLLYIDLNGRASPIWEQKGSYVVWGDPSPDGRHLAILGWTRDSNVWMLENF